MDKPQQPEGARPSGRARHRGEASTAEAAQSQPGASTEPPLLLGGSPAMVQLRRQIMQAARVDAPVLIGGESGCGKELVAQAICRASTRRHGPFIAVNCGAISPSLAQSELFGHARGAFTGADRDRVGLIEAGHGGTVFLDEVGDLPAELQTSLLRILQEKTLMRVGSSQQRRVDVRVLAATHVDLPAAVAAGRFREDLFYRLSVLTLRVPPLRERREDIVTLAEMAYRQFDVEKMPQLQGFSLAAVQAMQAYRWPGNVRELMNRVRRAMVMSEGRLISVSDLGLDDGRGMDAAGGLVKTPAHAVLDASLGDGADVVPCLLQARRDAERDAVLDSLAQSRHNVSEAARRLGVSRMTLYRLMARHGIQA